MDVHDITEGEEECATNWMVVEKLKRLRENLRNIGQVAFKIDDILHCLNHCRCVSFIFSINYRTHNARVSNF